MTRYLEIKPGSISETIKRLSDDYQAIFKKELEKTGKGIGSMTPDEKKAFFNKIDKMHNAKNEAMDSSWIKKEIDKEKKTTLVAAPGNKEKVIRIPKEKLADYKAKGYVEAESYIPEAKKVKEEEIKEEIKVDKPAIIKSLQDRLKKLESDPDHGGKQDMIAYVKSKLKMLQSTKDEELTAGQKKLPPALQKAIEKKDKKEEVEITETEGGSGGGIDALRAIKGKRLRLQGELDALNKDDPNYKEKKAAKQKEIEAQKEIMARKQREVYGSYDPSREDALDLNEITDEEEKNYARQITSLSNDKVMARINKKGDEAIAAIQAKIDSVKSERDKKRAQKNEETELEEACWTGYKKVGMKKKGDRMVPNCIPEGYVTESGDIVEFVELDEGQFKDIDVRKGDLKLAKDKKENLKNKYNAIMANQAQGDENAIADQIQKLDMSIKKQEQELIDIMKKQKETKSEEVETVSEYTGPDRLTNLNDKITKLQVNISKLDMSKPENKTKEAIMKADLTTAKLRLQDVIQKKNTETKKESVNEAKKTYKSIKKSVKKEQDKEVNSKRTLTDKPLTKVDVDPKIEN
jgi:hypothetical protein